ncbi:hypothetical protein BDU57DRAFT_53878 [Ampelomyces quisqualis]|uniref:ubiquitinyl hydrolase 1 n=1 Tax=Ampelomyces quisqualis TaxID=50730 RepID=A0A6A5R3J4_AMPQU|nr:hypothetical protein BDU57DRAFT_53878 [Ampelomyces quisqualis]
MSDYEQASFDDSFRRWSAPESNSSLAWILPTTILCAYVFLQALQSFQFPVWAWIVQLFRPVAPSNEAGFSESTMQRTGGLLRSILGLNGEGLLQKGVRGFKSALGGGPNDVPPGLGNISNSCYQNSIIQGLAALPSLRDYLSTVTAEHPSLTAETTNGALHDLISKLNDPANTGHNFWIGGKLKSMSTFTQQDAQEYYSKVLDELDREVKKVSSSKRRSSVSWLEATKSLSDSPEAKEQAAPVSANSCTDSKMLPNPLDGLLAQRVGCTACGYSEGLSLIDFNCITVSLGANHGYDIRECLDEYTKLEYIDGVECAKCTLLKLEKTLTPLATANPDSPFAAKLQAVSEMLEDEKLDDNTLVKTLNIPKKNWLKSSKSKQIVVARAPKSLVLHVNRSIFDETTFAQYKNTAGVSYPKILDLGNWCLGNSPSGSRQPDMSLEKWPRDPKESMLKETDEEVVMSPFQYRLRAAVTHFGSHGNGHYVCYRPHARIVTESVKSDNKDTAQSPDESRSEQPCDSSTQSFMGRTIDPMTESLTQPCTEMFEEQWWRFSDDTVYAVQEEQAHQANVFMLFYERLGEPVTTDAPEAKSIPATIAVAEDAPLPHGKPQPGIGDVVDVEAAITTPLPDDDDLFDLIPSEQSNEPASSIAVVAPPTTLPPHPWLTQDGQATRGGLSSQDTETEMSEAESEDAPSTQVTSDDETELSHPPTPKPITRVPPHAMRTAGNAGARGQGSRQSLPMVSAT